MFSLGFLETSLSSYYRPETSENIDNSFIHDCTLDNNINNTLMKNDTIINWKSEG